MGPHTQTAAVGDQWKQMGPHTQAAGRIRELLLFGVAASRLEISQAQTQAGWKVVLGV